jgi:hypothetical protein
VRRIVYLGPHAEVSIPALAGVVVQRGVPISTAPDLTERLLRQSTWSEVPTPPKTKAKEVTS